MSPCLSLRPLSPITSTHPTSALSSPHVLPVSYAHHFSILYPALAFDLIFVSTQPPSHTHLIFHLNSGFLAASLYPMFLSHTYWTQENSSIREKISQKHCTTLNRLRTGVDQYKASKKKWRLADSAPCECGEPEQTADHIINSCPVHRPPSEAGIFEIGPLTRAWLQQTELTI